MTDINLCVQKPLEITKKTVFYINYFTFGTNTTFVTVLDCSLFFQQDSAL